MEQNFINREKLEKELAKYKVRIFRDVHVSGHAGREDLRDLVEMVKPKFIIPVHGTKDKSLAMKELCKELNYPSSRIKIMNDGDNIKV